MTDDSQSLLYVLSVKYVIMSPSVCASSKIAKMAELMWNLLLMYYFQILLAKMATLVHRDINATP